MALKFFRRIFSSNSFQIRPLLSSFVVQILDTSLDLEKTVLVPMKISGPNGLFEIKGGTPPYRIESLYIDNTSLSKPEVDNSEAPFSINEVKQMVKQTICLDYNEVSDITPDIRITFYNAGHILGSAMTHLHIGNGLHNLLYTGDMLYDYSNLLSRAVTRFPRLETVIVESTYGSKNDMLPTRTDCENELIEIIKETVKNGGKILMPVLGVGRSQEIMVILEKAMREGRVPKMPIYVQGMVWDVTAIHTAYPDFFNNS